MSTLTLRTTLAALSLGLLAALPLAPASAQSEHEGHHPQNMQGQSGMGNQQMPHGGNMDHGQMNHEQMQQMHDQHMNNGQMDHGNMDHGQMNHGNMPPAKAAPSAKEGKDNGQ